MENHFKSKVTSLKLVWKHALFSFRSKITLSEKLSFVAYALNVLGVCATMEASTHIALSEHALYYMQIMKSKTHLVCGGK